MKIPGNTRETTDGIVNPESAIALARFKKPLLEYLVSALDHPDKGVRCMAAEMIGAVKDPEAAGHLVPLMVCEDPYLREAARHALGTVEAYHVKPPFGEAPECTGCLIRCIAEEALCLLKQPDNRASPR